MGVQASAGLFQIFNNWCKTFSTTHWNQVLLYKLSQHVVSDGGHDVAEVQGSDGATLLFVFLCKSLAGMLQLQLL